MRGSCLVNGEPGGLGIADHPWPDGDREHLIIGRCRRGSAQRLQDIGEKRVGAAARSRHDDRPRGRP